MSHVAPEVAPEVAPNLSYPIGKYAPPEVIDAAMLEAWIAELATTAVHLREAVAGLSNAQLDTPYRPGGWTVRQTVHHVADSHMNAYIRFKLALTEENPVISAYSQPDWADLADSQLPVEVSLILTETLHQRMVALLRSVKPNQWARTFRHPEMGNRRIDVTVGLYAWHGKHHAAHITELRKRNGW